MQVLTDGTLKALGKLVNISSDPQQIAETTGQVHKDPLSHPEER